jgi:hypothetical protein
MIMLETVLIRRYIRLVLPILVIVAACLKAAPQCPPGTRVLYAMCDPALEASTYQGFTAALAALLAAPLSEIGYCLAPVGNLPIIDTLAVRDSTDAFVLYCGISREPSQDSNTIIVAVLRRSVYSPGTMIHALQRPLVSMPLEATPSEAFMTALTKKIIENLRTSYICHIVIDSDPQGAAITATAGLEGVTPLEWVFPVGAIDITAAKERYVPLRKTMSLSTPGSHRIYLQLTKRRFYHSRLTIGTAASLILAGACYGIERYYYDRYLSYGESDYNADPAKFKRTFGTAKSFEHGAQVSLGCAALFFAFSFRF